MQHVTALRTFSPDQTGFRARLYTVVHGLLLSGTSQDTVVHVLLLRGMLTDMVKHG